MRMLTGHAMFGCSLDVWANLPALLEPPKHRVRQSSQHLCRWRHDGRHPIKHTVPSCSTTWSTARSRSERRPHTPNTPAVLPIQHVIEMAPRPHREDHCKVSRPPP